MKLTRISAAVLTVCLGSTAAMAAQDVYTKGVEVTATRVTRDLMDVPMSVGVVTEDDIKKSGVTTIGELIQDVPGVELQNDGTPGLIRVSIRGEGTMRSTILIDGQRISEHKSMSGTPILIDPSAVERVEVIKGPASVLYGSDAIGGVINIITKKGGKKPVQLDVGVGYNGAGDGFTENASVSGSYNGFNYRLSGSYADFGDLRTPDKTIDGTDYDTRSGSVFLSYDFTDDLTMGVSADYFEGNFNTATDDAESYDDFAVRIQPWKRQKFAFFADATNLNEYWARLRFDVYTQKTDKKMQNIVGMGMGTQTTEMMGKPVTLYNSSMHMDNHADNEIKSNGVSVQTEWQLGENNYLIAGAGFDSDKLDAYTFNDMAISGDLAPIPGVSVFTMKPSTITDLEGGQDTYYLFLSNETILPADFTANYGVRFTHVKTSLDNVSSRYAPEAGGYINGSPMFSLVDMGQTPDAKAFEGEESNSKAVFNFGLVWRGIEDLALRATWAQGFRAPTIQEKFLTSSMGGGTEIGNPNLDPETSDNFELGARYSGERLNLDFAAFLNLADDYITTKEVSAETYQYYNVGKATTYGVELSASYDLPYGFTPYTSMTWLKRKFEYGGIIGDTYDTNTPEFMYRAGVRYEKDFGIWTLTADTYARGATERDYEYESSGAVVKTHHGGYTTANFEVGAAFGDERQYSVNAAVLNIFDKKYYISDALPEAGVHAVVTANARF
ncbi:TonB-dependent receptor plug domain-containing protein [Succinatimonas hippei]|uniref:TonB-dependent receptor plug domain protein n=1 Tax=Succinatimonas hippei (strain DSM 22608 / JCM 16073 / KCTC 15190 / YIT 12066) TaxID=762983 RepID=E8LH63_SUCHY|nr:TonB-dependent receptor [Succinatimonas hippei]EFY08157.1 TonB-dependent receptor plug domain protein [Succinatimonas hippei YIT 12066]